MHKKGRRLCGSSEAQSSASRLWFGPELCVGDLEDEELVDDIARKDN